MKALSIDIEGFGPYRSKQHIDFTEFDGEGLFVITGKTGAGKSTILDAICFALYGEVPRYEKTEKSLRSDFCNEDDPTSVTLEFEVGNHRYKIWRSPDYERAKKRGSGTTTKQAEAELHEWLDGRWKALEVKPREVGYRMLAIMQLTVDQFLQVILLAQGRFSEFLQTGTAERLKVLRSLFDTGRFEQLEHQVRDLAKTREQALQSADVALTGLVERAVLLASTESPELAQLDSWFAAQAERLDAESKAATKARAKASKAADAAAQALTDAESVERKRVQLDNARATLAELEAKSGDHDKDRARLEAAKRAQPVRAPLAARDETLEALTYATADAEEGLTEALSIEHIDIAWPNELGPLSAAEGAGLKAQLVEITQARGSLDEALSAEVKLEDLAEQRLFAEQALQARNSWRDDLTKEIADAPQALKEIKDNLAESIAALEKLPALEKNLGSARESLDAHKSAATLTGLLDALREAEGTASAAHVAAVEHHDDLIQRRLHGEAARLADNLVDGEKCPVCGSTEHPSPAAPATDTVSDDQVEAAHLQMEAGSRALTEATVAVRDHASKLREAIPKAVGTHGEAADVFARAESSVNDTRALADTREQWEREIATHGEAIEAKREALAKASEDVAVASTALATAANNVKTARDMVERSRQGFESVAERVDALDEARDSLNAVASTNEARDQATKAVASAQRTLDAAIAEGGFASVEEASEATLDPEELATLAAQVDEFTANRTGAQAVVKELSAETLPPQVADLDALREVEKNAKAVRDAAVETHTSAARDATDFGALRAEYVSANENTAIARRQRDLATALANTIEGKPPNDRRMRLESFVLAAKLESIVAAANARLVTMSSNQYRLEYDDGRQHRNVETGLGLRVFDTHTGRSRSTRSLSGGETFLASLALALGLAETVTAEAGGIQLNTLFIDEGFGSLDGDTLEVAMATLDNLRTGGRTIGLISHVEAMKEAIPAKLEVTKEQDGSSSCRSRSGR